MVSSSRTTKPHKVFPPRWQNFWNLFHSLVINQNPLALIVQTLLSVCSAHLLSAFLSYRTWKKWAWGSKPGVNSSGTAPKQLLVLSSKSVRDQCFDVLLTLVQFAPVSCAAVCGGHISSPPSFSKPFTQDSPEEPFLLLENQHWRWKPRSVSRISPLAAETSVLLSQHMISFTIIFIRTVELQPLVYYPRVHSRSVFYEKQFPGH